MDKPSAPYLFYPDVTAFANDELATGEWHGISWPGAPYPVVMRLGLSPEGRVICRGLILGGAIRPTGTTKSNGAPEVEITASSLRKLPLGLLMDELSIGAIDSPFLNWLPTYKRPTRLGPRGMRPEKLTEVASLYRRGLRERPSAPVLWVAEHYRTPEGNPTPAVTVRRWLQRCRDMGLLGASIPGKAGERPRAPKGKRHP